MRTKPSRTTLLALTAACAVAAACGSLAGAKPPSPQPVLRGGPVDVVVQGAVDRELAPLVEALSNPTRIQIGAWTFWRGRMGERSVVVSRTEVGPINAAVATTLAITNFKPRLVINQGTAGATDPDLRVFDIVVGEAAVDYGGFQSEHAGAGQGSDQRRWIRLLHRLRFGEERIELPLFPSNPEAVAFAARQPYAHGRVVKGIVGSAFQFNREVDRLLWIREKYGAISEDMESAFASGAALGFETPFLAVRIISDSDFYAPGVHPDAAGRCAEFVARLVTAIPLSAPGR